MTNDEMTTGNLISVIIPVFNAEKYLSECLNSIVSNTYKDLEIICIDDGSTDRSPDILKDFATNDHRIKIITQENQGVSSARNAGLKAMTGDFAAFVDSDDMIHPQFFEVLYNALQNSHSHLAAASFTRVSEFQAIERADTPELEILPYHRLFSDKRTRTNTCSILFQSRILNGLYFDSNICYGEDELFNTQLYCSDANIKACVLPYCLYFYRQNPESIVHTHSYRDLIPSHVRYIDLIKQMQNPAAKAAMLERKMKSLLFGRYCLSLSHEKSSKKEYNLMLRKLTKEYADISGAAISKKIQFTLLYVFPVAYRVFRIIDDPTIRKWEKQH